MRYCFLRQYLHSDHTIGLIAAKTAIVAGTDSAKKQVEDYMKVLENAAKAEHDHRLEAERTITFINDQLIGITDSLSITEDKLQKFRSENKVMDISAQGQLIIDQAMSLENARAKLVIEKNYYEGLLDTTFGTMRTVMNCLIVETQMIQSL